ncbi:RCC1 domain-containing protein [Pseudomonas japonica]|uniref:RCC1 domain-containing protein n=1 Tax=Pseudomonas japonica TaxID=256466 RepID=UPI0038286336
MTTDESAPLNLDPLLIPGLIVPVQTEGADGGVNYGMLISNENGLLVQVQPYLNMEEGDWIDVFWGDADSPVAGDRVLDEHVGDKFGLFISADFIPDGISDVWARVTRSGGGNGGESLPLAVLVRTVLPGGIDPEPDVPGHQALPAPEPELPPSGIIDEEAAKNGIKVTIGSYPNMRVFDTITFSWGGVLLQHEVTQDEVDAGSLEILVNEDVILEAGDSNDLVLVYRVRDEVHNPSSEWSMRTLVHVEVGKGLFNAPLIVNPDPEADPYDVIDLDVLGDDDLVVSVYAEPNGKLQIGDVVTLKWVGTTAQGEPITVQPEAKTVVRIPINLEFIIPNADVTRLGRGRGIASFTVTRDDSAAGVSKRSFVTFLGVEQGLPKPLVPDAVDGVLDPTLSETLVIVPGEALGAGDEVQLVWLGIRANGSPLLHEDGRTVSGGNAGKPMSFVIPASAIAPLDGGSVSVHYRLIKFAGGELESERERLSVGEAREALPAPFTRPPVEDGVLDPDTLPLQLQIVVPPWPGMQAEQRVYVIWRASSGPHFDDWIPISSGQVGEEVVFVLDRSHIEENLGAQIELSYRVESDGEPTLVSQVAVFGIGPGTGVLPLPKILGVEDGRLDPDAFLHGATVRIDAAAQFAEGDLVTLTVTSSAEGGSVERTWRIEADGAGQALETVLAYDLLNASTGTSIDLQYQVIRASDGAVEQSGTKSYTVSAQVGVGPMRIMGARSAAHYLPKTPMLQVLSSLHDVTLVPMRVEWRYENAENWTARTHWIDTRPWLKLYVRNRSETWECRAINVIGNGGGIRPEGNSAFAAMSDQVTGPNGPESDLVAWGRADWGGKLSDDASAVDSVVAISATSAAFAARLRDGSAVSWGEPDYGGAPSLMPGEFVEITGNSGAFAARKADGSLQAWGHYASFGIPVPPEVLQHQDYIELCGAVNAFAARRATGHVVAWGLKERGGLLEPGQELMDDIVQLNSNAGGFMALRVQGSSRRVISWGLHQIKVPDDILRLTNVRSLGAGTHYGFCILLETGEVKAWGDAAGTLPDSIKRLKNVVHVCATANAYCVRLSNGKVAAWGPETEGGKLSEEAEARSDIVQVTSNTQAFAALCSDGSVVAWGNPEGGGDTSAVSANLVNVRAIYATGGAFAALTSDGHVVTWGSAPGGGDSRAVQHLLNGRVTARRLLPPDEAKALGGIVGNRRA